jgi:hypothetical protein
MKTILRRSHTAAQWGAILLLGLAACGTLPGTTAAPNTALLQSAALETTGPATGAASPTHRSNNNGQQAAATAEIVRANAQATLNSANATVNAAQTQDQNSANFAAAQLASTAEIESAHAQATLLAAGSTQSAALTQDAIQQTQAADQATTGAAAVINRQNQDELAAGTQTAVANGIATQDRSAVATSQWYTDQARMRNEQRQVPLGFLWTWGLPTFVVLLAGLALWGFWRWLRLRQAKQRMLNGLLEQLPAQAPKTVSYRHDDSSSYLEGQDVDSRYELTNPDDPVHGWLDDVKRKLQSSDEKDEDDNTDR